MDIFCITLSCAFLDLEEKCRAMLICKEIHRNIINIPFVWERLYTYDTYYLVYNGKKIIELIKKYTKKAYVTIYNQNEVLPDGVIVWALTAQLITSLSYNFGYLYANRIECFYDKEVPMDNTSSWYNITTKVLHITLNSTEIKSVRMPIGFIVTKTFKLTCTCMGESINPGSLSRNVKYIKIKGMGFVLNRLIKHKNLRKIEADKLVLKNTEDILPANIQKVKLKRLSNQPSKNMFLYLEANGFTLYDSFGHPYEANNNKRHPTFKYAKRKQIN
jgi:hypothetical protein